MAFDEFVERFQYRRFDRFAPYADEFTHFEGVHYRVPTVDGLFLAAAVIAGDDADDFPVITGAKWVCNEYWLRRSAGKVGQGEEPPARRWDLPESEFLPPDLRQAAATRWLVDRDGSAKTGAAYFRGGAVNYAEVSIRRPHRIDLLYGTDVTMSDELPVAIRVVLLSPDRAPGR